MLGSIQPQPVPVGDDGMIDLDAAAAAVKAPDHHFARTRLLCLENTADGKVLTLEQMADSAAVASRHGLAHHLDGARLWNAAVLAAGLDAIDGVKIDSCATNMVFIRLDEASANTPGHGRIDHALPAWSTADQRRRRARRAAAASRAATTGMSASTARDCGTSWPGGASSPAGAGRRPGL